MTACHKVVFWLSSHLVINSNALCKLRLLKLLLQKKLITRHCCSYILHVVCKCQKTTHREICLHFVTVVFYLVRSCNRQFIVGTKITDKPFSIIIICHILSINSAFYQNRCIYGKGQMCFFSNAPRFTRSINITNSLNGLGQWQLFLRPECRDSCVFVQKFV